MLIGDMTAQMGNNKITNIVGTNGEASLSNSGKKLIDLCTFSNLKVMNTFFKHKEIHKFTWKARRYKSVIDYFITN
jgi:hypothetical protein